MFPNKIRKQDAPNKIIQDCDKKENLPLQGGAVTVNSKVASTIAISDLSKKSSEPRRSPRLDRNKPSAKGKEESEQEIFESENHNLKLGIGPGSGAPPVRSNNSGFGRFEKTSSQINVIFEDENKSTTILSTKQLFPNKENPKECFTKLAVLGTPQKDKIIYLRAPDRTILNQCLTIICNSDIPKETGKYTFFAAPVSPSKRRKLMGYAVIISHELSELLEEYKKATALTYKQGKVVFNLSNKKEVIDAQRAIDAKNFPKLTPLTDNYCKSFTDIIITRDTATRWFYKAREPRSPTQEGSFGCSATKYVTTHGAEDTKSDNGRSDWNISHLFAHSLGGFDGKNPQVPENFVITTAGCNTWMMLAEMAVRYLFRYMDCVILSPKAHLIPGTHIAHTIEYTIKWGVLGYSLTFTFDGLKHDAPCAALADVILGIVDEKVQKELKILEQRSASSNSVSNADTTPPTEDKKNIIINLKRKFDETSASLSRSDNFLDQLTASVSKAFTK